MEEKKVFVGGNWKSNGYIKFCREFIESTLNKMKVDANKIEVVVAPMTIHIPGVKAMLLPFV